MPTNDRGFHVLCVGNSLSISKSYIWVTVWEMMGREGDGGLTTHHIECLVCKLFFLNEITFYGAGKMLYKELSIW